MTQVNDPFSVMADYVRSLASCMGLRDWKVYVQNRDPAEGRLAESECTPGRRVVVIAIGEAFFSASPEDQRHAVIHELIHPHFDAVLSASELIREDVGRVAFDQFYRNLQMRIEEGVDAVASAWADKMPLPPG